MATRRTFLKLAGMALTGLLVRAPELEAIALPRADMAPAVESFTTFEEMVSRVARAMDLELTRQRWRSARPPDTSEGRSLYEEVDGVTLATMVNSSGADAEVGTNIAPSHYPGCWRYGTDLIGEHLDAIGRSIAERVLEANPTVLAAPPIPHGVDAAHRLRGPSGVALRGILAYDVLQDAYITRFDVLGGTA